MTPAQPPLPVPKNLPFQPAAGSQISWLIEEPADKALCTSARQNAGASMTGSSAEGLNAPVLNSVLIVLPEPRSSEPRAAHADSGLEGLAPSDRESLVGLNKQRTHAHATAITLICST